jgi:hypothetical protein
MFIESQRPTGKPIKVSAQLYIAGHVRTPKMESTSVQGKYIWEWRGIRRKKTNQMIYNDWKRKVERYGEKEEKRNKGEREQTEESSYFVFRHKYLRKIEEVNNKTVREKHTETKARMN